MKKVSDNKYEFNLRKVEEYEEQLSKLEEELKTVKGFFNKLKLKKTIIKVNKELESLNDEIFIYEQRKVEGN